MAKIISLSEEEIAKIAAGQVAERPAHIVKELLENSIDAQATTIDVYCENFGQTLIRIVDNGCGMNIDDAQRSFDRHTTSKITSLADLETIQSFGFRGEALASIAAVSKVSIHTKPINDTVGTYIYKEGSSTTVREIACNQGTDVRIQDLFYNTPVRKKFLKKPQTEWNHIIQIFQALSFAYPNINMNLYHNNKRIYICTENNTLIERAQTFWSSLNAEQCITLEAQQDGLLMHGLISNYQYHVYHRNNIFCFINRRWTKNYQLTNALLAGYTNILPPKKYPTAILHITMNQAFIDINIHPRKEEVAFMQPRLLAGFISTTIKKNLEQQVTQNLQSTFNTSRSSEYTSFPHTSLAHVIAHNTHNYQEAPAAKHTIQPNISADETDHIQESEKQLVINSTNSLGSFIGTLHNTYLLLEHTDGLFMIDQHAAHERILYEKFKKNFTNIPTISLLFPETISLHQKEYTALQQHQNILHNHGIITKFQEANHIQIIAAPAHIKHVMFSEIIQYITTLLIEESDNHEEGTHNLLHEKIHAQLACKAAVKAGDVLSTAQITALIEDLIITDNKSSCPHGRPIGWLMPIATIETNFKRRL